MDGEAIANPFSFLLTCSRQKEHTWERRVSFYIGLGLQLVGFALVGLCLAGGIAAGDYGRIELAQFIGGMLLFYGGNLFKGGRRA